MPDTAIDTAPHVTEPPEQNGGDKLTRQATVTIGVLIVSTFTAILNEMLMAVALPRLALAAFAAAFFLPKKAVPNGAPVAVH